MELSDETCLVEIESEALRQLAASGRATLSAETLTLALGARCHEEVRVWVENFCRRHALRVEEDSTQQIFTLRRDFP